ncbi:MAG TPA: regulatory protein RecX [Pseudonocardiaceae bacterium]|jgi:regulatory protein|nr:regulatory protein RecX [Pseudonocardiaceae bacterium]
MAAQSIETVAQAKECCLRLLAARPRTRAELHQALVRRGAAEDMAEQVLGRLDEVGLVDDAGFAEQWVRSRHTYQGMGRRALVSELRRRGVEDSVAAEAANAVDADAEEQRARQLVRAKLRIASSADETTQIRRLVSMLARKGYSSGLSYRVVKDELRNVGADTNLLDGALGE